MSVFSTSSLSASDSSFTRRVKPLPKRRRTSGARSDGDGLDSPFASSYYHPIRSGRIRRLKQESNVTPQSVSTANSFSLLARGRVVDDVDGEGDYADHLQQPNNTKKRKVPAANTLGIAHGDSSTLWDEDKFDESKSEHSRTNLFGHAQGAGAMSDTLGLYPLSIFASHQKKRSPVTSATLRLKELLGARHKLLAGVIDKGTDPLALNFALSSTFARSRFDQLPRLHYRHPKLRRRPQSSALLDSRGSWLSGQFTFSCPIPASVKYNLAKTTAASLRLRFQAELARQTTNISGISPKVTSKLPNTGQQKKVESSLARVLPTTTPLPEGTRPPAKSTKTKKKKRSALANASNPHHLRNYVPSRVPQSNGYPTSTSVHGQPPNTVLGRLALKFLSATLPPRRKGRLAGSENVAPSLVRPENEWICPFCEYDLFYGDDVSMHRAVKNRRKMLKRRRKARERAAAAASGATVPNSQDVSESETEDDGDDDSLDDVEDVSPAAVPRQVGRAGLRQETPGPHPGG